MPRADAPRVTRRRLLAVLALVAALAVATPSPAVAAADTQKLRAARPVYQVGDKWLRTDGEYQLVRIERDVYVFSAGAGKEFHLTKDLAVARIVLDGRTELDIEPPPKFSWPLEVGGGGVGPSSCRPAPPRPLVTFTGSINVSWQVELAEDLATAAGTFRTLRINQKIETVSGSFGGGSGQQFGQVFLWYAPDVQRFVKAESNLKGLSWGLAGAARPPAPPVIASPPPAPPVVVPPPSPPPTPAPPAATQPKVAMPAPVAPAPPATPPPAPVPTPVAPLRRGDVEAPKITINSPSPDARLAEEQILITGLVTDNVEVVRVQVLVNGVEATPLGEVGVTGRGVPLGAIAALKPGPNVIEVIATDKAGNVAQLLRTVTRVIAAPPPGQTPTSEAPRR
jgi:Bacterial Ig domain